MRMMLNQCFGEMRFLLASWLLLVRMDVRTKTCDDGQGWRRNTVSGVPGVGKVGRNLVVGGHSYWTEGRAHVLVYLLV
ncbi:hypothetical protein GGR57DRAFT_360143 [Xylariaceae sp. FL1272]|nr:hypothetical protein GGR57DRAFT_360143 [Xylariaceae sp. FL1272]